MTGKLEETLKKIEKTTENLKQVMLKIDEYHKSNNTHGDNDNGYYKKNIDARDNLAINLNYYQNQVMIEQNKEIINNLNTLIRKDK